MGTYGNLGRYTGGPDVKLALYLNMVSSYPLHDTEPLKLRNLGNPPTTFTGHLLSF